MPKRVFLGTVIIILLVMLSYLMYGATVAISDNAQNPNRISHTPLIYPWWVYMAALDPISDRYGPTGTGEYYRIEAVEKGDVRICDERFSEYRSARLRCYAHVARTVKDVKICETISDEERRLFSDLSAYNSFADDCYSSLAEVTMNVSLCEKLDVAENRPYCRDGVWREKATRESNPALCEKIQDDLYKNNCYELLN